MSRLRRHLAARLPRGWRRLAFAILFFAFMVQIVSRYVFNTPVSWSLELCSIAYVWVVFWSAGILVPERQHIAFDVLYHWFPPRARRWVAVFLTAQPRASSSSRRCPACSTTSASSAGGAP